ncbi:hypothetical protein [Amphritea sp.]|uniref:hypothetical protein n=1 Tax=Amphritea sp. TaxID=1872502 RepID=UPI003A8E888B
MIIDYKEVESFETIASDVRVEIPANEHCTNYIIAYKIDRENLQKNPMIDVAEEAKDWASEDRPKHLFFNHGEFRKGGLKYISQELKKKPTSNRALYSLINQDDISNSGDEPIPSFMIFQCLFDEHEKTMNCTVYFRALEVSSFLRINLEEIRQNLLNIYEEGVDYHQIKLLIVVGRAYHSPEFIPLKRPKIDTLTAIKIFVMVTENLSNFEPLLSEKANTQTVISYESLEHLKESLNQAGVGNHLMISDLDKAIKLSKKLQKAREEHSHAERVSELNNELREILQALAKRFSNE